MKAYKKRYFIFVSAILAAVLILAGCGGQQAETAAVSEEKTEATSVPEEKPAADVNKETAETTPDAIEEASGVEETEDEEWTTIAVGTTGYTLDIPADYRFDDITDEDRDDDQVSYLRSFSRGMDFDVYQFEKEGRTLEEYAKEEAAEYDTDDIEMIKIGGVDAALYFSTEEFEGESYPVSNYLFDTGDYFAEVCFWLDGEEAEVVSESIMNSLSDGGVVISVNEIVPGDPAGIRLVLSNPSPKDISFDLDAYTLRSGSERYVPMGASIHLEAGKKDFDSTIYTSAEGLDPGTELSLYYGNILIEGSGDEEAEAVPDKKVTEAPAEESTAPAEDQTDASFVGDWKVYAVEYPDNPESNVTHEQVVESKEQGFDYSMIQVMTLKDDGTYIVNMLGDLTEGTWTDNGDGTGIITVEGRDYPIAMDGALLIGYADDNTTIYERSEVSAEEAG